MIDVKNLMIGDWVAFGKDYVRIEAIETGFIGEKDMASLILRPNETVTVTVTADRIAPVALTADILRGCGFEETVKCRDDEGIEHFSLSTDCGYVRVWRMWEAPTWDVTALHKRRVSDNGWQIDKKYVGWAESLHELQHVLRLCGIDIEIKL